MKVSTEEIVNIKKQNWFVGFWNKILSPKAPMASRKQLTFKAYEWLVVIGISLLYAFFAFTNLGDRFAPKTSGYFPQNVPVEIVAPSDADIRTVWWCLWDMPNSTYKVEIKRTSAEEWELVDVNENKVVLGYWSGFGLPYAVKEVRITHDTRSVAIREMAIMDLGGNVLRPTNANKYPELFDEQDLVPDELNYMNSFYFDEALYAPAAFELMNGYPATYEYTHPPFGKILIAMGIYLFGYNPFGIRFVGALLGVLMLPCFYLMARNVFRNRGVAAFCMFLFAFDFMHFTQTRLATIDVFIVFFIILMYYFMEKYVNLSFYDTPLIKTWIPLGCCGVLFGFGIATKWTGFYAGAGLAILFFARMIGYYREYKYALLEPDADTNGISHRSVIESFKKNIIKTIMFCIVFYIVIPFVIYLLSYIPFVDGVNSGLLERMVANQKYIFGFHSEADYFHEYASRWYEWPIMIRPICYYANNLGGVARQGINAFGNPMVWWAGIPAFIFTFILAVWKKKKEAIFLCVSYFAQYLPWVFISRPTFIYHYFTSVPFITLMIGYCFLQVKDKAIEKKMLDEKSFYALLIIYAAVAFGLFQLFLPVISGETISYSYAESLAWLKEWNFVEHK